MSSKELNPQRRAPERGVKHTLERGERSSKHGMEGAKGATRVPPPPASDILAVLAALGTQDDEPNVNLNQFKDKSQ